MNEEAKIEARYKLVQSAKLAYRSGYSQIEWMQSDTAQNYVKKTGLDEDILDHIASWVWTFKKS